MPRGRNKTLIERRDDALCRRYYHWTEVERLRFDDALRILSEREFFLSVDRILSILRTQSRRVADTSASAPCADAKSVSAPHKPRIPRNMVSRLRRE